MTQGSAYRLPRTVTPSHYDIELRLDPGAPTFDGTVDIAVTVHVAVAEIVLNAKEVTIVVGAIITADGTVIDVQKVVPDARTERLTLMLDGELPAGDYTVRLAFTARLSDHMVGIYRSRYRDDAGAEQIVITTHFEATDARRSFPCWDEPDRWWCPMGSPRWRIRRRSVARPPTRASPACASHNRW
jgi:aminopeptidase N